MKKVLHISVSAIFVLAIIIMVSCTKSTPYDRATEISMIETFMDDRGLDITPTVTGLYFLEQLAGSGEPALEYDTVNVEYTGYFIDGRKFDGGEFRFILDYQYSSAIDGFNEAVMLMSGIGSEAIVIIPSWLAYGSSGSGSIPPNTPLYFEIDLLEVDRGPLTE